MTKYIIRVALHEEANEGWIWTKGFRSRTIVRIRNPANKSTVFCQIRRLDENFVEIYNDDPKKRRIPLIDADTIVMSQWFRDALGELKTTHPNNKTGLVNLKIDPYEHYWRWWGSLRAAAHHPDIVVRLGTRLGVIGVWLGLVGIGIPLLQMILSCEWAAFAVTAAVLIVFMALGTWACWPPSFRNKI